MQENIKDEFTRIAREYLLENIGDDVDIVEEHVKDLDDLFYFSYQSKEFLKTKNFEDKLIGQGPMFIIKKDGRIVSYGSALGSKEARIDVINKLNKERLIRIFQEDYDIWQDNYDLIINDIYEDDEYEDYKELEELTTVLLRNKIYYLLRDENNEVKRHCYTEEKLKEILQKTPANLGHNFDEYLEDVLIDLINTNIYFKWALSEVK